MTSTGVSDVWVSINGGDYVTYTAQEGDVWTFPVNRSLGGHVTIEAWAEDAAGNQTYKAVIIELSEGTIKAVRWLATGGECVMLRIQRPVTEPMERPMCAWLPHECGRNGYATVL